MHVLILSLFTVVLSSLAFAQPAHIVILRHGEKINDEDRHLSPRGFERSEALVKVLTSDEFQKTYGIPTIFAASPKAESSLRSVETIRPTAHAYGAKLNMKIDKDDGALLMESILQDPSLDGKTVIICWNRSGMKDLLEPLSGGPFPKKWPDNVFDRFWILDLTSSGDYSFKNLPQQLLDGDSDK